MVALLHPKPFRSTPELVTLLTNERCLHCEDSKALESFLENTNYYRFTGYARQWQRDPSRHDDQFLEEANFEHIRSMMDKDHRLRQLTMEQISYVETSVRTRYAHELGKLYGEKAFYFDSELYNKNTNKDGIPIDIPKELLSDITRSRSRMIHHYRKRASSQGVQYKAFEDLPIWVAVEVLSLGKISKMIRDFSDITAAKSVTEQLGVQWVPFTGAIHSICVLRNMCAHHDQLWHRPLDIACTVPKKLKPQGIRFDKQSIFAAIIMLNFYRRKIDGDSSTSDEILELIQSDADFQRGICFPSPK
ncbi:MAG: Abi family protein [Bifidobacteriaceae bacterium]|jgi:abortive infection bacteriophage resistance protein|nr:Abi family protein [Bifidobacteriaceae bacterium]